MALGEAETCGLAELLRRVGQLEGSAGHTCRRGATKTTVVSSRTLCRGRELEARRGQVKRADDRLIEVCAHLRQRVLQPFAR